jgi:hypothetical protein
MNQNTSKEDMPNDSMTTAPDSAAHLYKEDEPYIPQREPDLVSQFDEPVERYETNLSEWEIPEIEMRRPNRKSARKRRVQQLRNRGRLAGWLGSYGPDQSRDGGARWINQIRRFLKHTDAYWTRSESASRHVEAASANREDWNHE